MHVSKFYVAGDGEEAESINTREGSIQRPKGERGGVGGVTEEFIDRPKEP